MPLPLFDLVVGPDADAANMVALNWHALTSDARAAAIGKRDQAVFAVDWPDPAPAAGLFIPGAVLAAASRDGSCSDYHDCKAYDAAVTRKLLGL